MNVLTIGLFEFETVFLSRSLPGLRIEALREKQLDELEKNTFDFWIVDPFVLSASSIDQLRKRLNTAPRPTVIVVTALSLIELKNLDLSFDRYVSKPYLIEELQQCFKDPANP